MEDKRGINISTIMIFLSLRCPLDGSKLSEDFKLLATSTRMPLSVINVRFLKS